MSYKKSLRGIAQYVQGTSREAEVLGANPHRLIQILMEVLQGRLVATKGAIERGDSIAKAQSSARAQAIITELRTSIDYEKGKEVAITLNSLYDYMGRRLMQAVSGNDATLVEEVINLLKPIKEGWDAIKNEAEAALDNQS